MEEAQVYFTFAKGRTLNSRWKHWRKDSLPRTPQAELGSPQRALSSPSLQDTGTLKAPAMVGAGGLDCSGSSRAGAASAGAELLKVNGRHQEPWEE